MNKLYSNKGSTARAAQYGLAKIRHGETKLYRDMKVIHPEKGDAFVTVRQSAQLA